MARKPKISLLNEINKFQRDCPISDNKIKNGAGVSAGVMKRIRDGNMDTKPEVVDKIMDFIDNYVAEDNDKRSLVA